MNNYQLSEDRAAFAKAKASPVSAHGMSFATIIVIGLHSVVQSQNGALWWEQLVTYLALAMWAAGTLTIESALHVRTGRKVGEFSAIVLARVARMPIIREKERSQEWLALTTTQHRIRLIRAGRIMLAGPIIILSYSLLLKLLPAFF